MKKSLVGYTGFVGGNLARQAEFDGLYNSKNIADAFGTRPELLVFAGVRAEKFLAARDPDGDRALMDEAFENILKIAPKKLVLISTVDVFKNPLAAYESTPVDTEGLHPYGRNRYYLEELVQKSGIPAAVVRLGALYGQGLKKNFLFDMINVIPALLSEEKFAQLTAGDDTLTRFYAKQANGFFKCRELDENEREFLKAYFENTGFTALNFTHSEAGFQFYNLDYLWQHINAALEAELPLVHLASAPTTAGEIYAHIKGAPFNNILQSPAPKYDFRTQHFDILGGEGGYIFSKDFVLEDVKRFVEKAGTL